MDSFKDIFQLAMQHCRSKLSDVAYNLWIAELEPIKMDGSTVYLHIRSEFKKNIVDEKYVPLLREAFAAVAGFEVDINIMCESAVSHDDCEFASTMVNIYSQAEQDFMTGRGDYDYTFNNFIVGSSNKFAHAAALAVATNPSNSYNPLFIYGASGLGKTHLLIAIKEEIKSRSGNSLVIYKRGEEFTNELISAISTESTNQFRESYRHCDVLLVDDIQFISGKERTQEEFFHTFNSLYQSGKQIVLTSDRPPKEIKTLEDRLRTRFEWGLLADIQPPDFETRMAIIRRKAELLNFEIPDEVAEYIANRLKNNIRQLEGAVKKLKAYRHLAGAAPSVLVAQNAIRDILNDNQPIPITVERIITEVSRTFGVNPADLRTAKRAAQISTARQVAIYIVREITQMSMSVIGMEFGGRDHSTIVYAIQQVERQMEKDPRYKETVEDIVKNIRDKQA